MNKVPSNLILSLLLPRLCFSNISILLFPPENMLTLTVCRGISNLSGLMDFLLLSVAVVIGISGLHSCWLFTAVAHELIARFPSQDNSEFRVRLGVC